MIQKLTKVNFKLLVLGILILIPFLSYAETPVEQILYRTVENFEAVNYRLGSVLSKISQNYGIQYGVEFILEEPNILSFTFSLKNPTLKEVLDTIVKIDRRYIWEEHNGIINLIPVQKKNDPTHIFNQIIPKFVVSERDFSGALNELATAIEGHELRAVSHGALPSGHTFSLSFEQVPVREVLDAIIKADGVYVWVWFGQGTTVKLIGTNINKKKANTN